MYITFTRPYSTYSYRSIFLYDIGILQKILYYYIENMYRNKFGIDFSHITNEMLTPHKKKKYTNQFFLFCY